MLIKSLSKVYNFLDSTNNFLARMIRSFVEKGTKKVLVAYCGINSNARCLVENTKKVVGLEIIGWL
ncbi:hypothetical protein AN643_02260 [Candidatus Epulonipiscioides saccharophilum]|nr:hypothetical protein AN643_02260 [Epulopiscium sp. SCG-B10WGA-EpuloB]